ncbi:MAG: ABC transporter ATP-binding protein [Candidatus Limnocylindrales bacterium]
MSNQTQPGQPAPPIRDEGASSGDKFYFVVAVLTAAAAVFLPWAGATGEDAQPVPLAGSYGGAGAAIVVVACLAVAGLVVAVVRRHLARPVRSGITLLAGLAIVGVLAFRHAELNGPHLIEGRTLILAPGLAYLVAALGGVLLTVFSAIRLGGDLDAWWRKRRRGPKVASTEMEQEAERQEEAERPLLSIRGLQTYFHVMDGVVKAVDGVDLEIPLGGTVGLVGESGCGKSVTALSVMRLIDTPPGEFAGGEIWFDGRDLLTLDGDEIRAVRGKDIAMIFQEPMTSLNPVFTIGDQITEAILQHNDVSKEEALEVAIESLRLVGVSDPQRRVKQYPHELSGGMRQRAMIAMALSCNPKLLIADEPTTALDVTIQAQILELIKDIQAKTGTALLLITHDLAVVAETVQNVAVMYAGRVVETGSVEDVLLGPTHPYTQGLLNSIPALHKRGRELDVIKGVVPNPFRMPPGCKFEPRCPYAWDRCRQSEPDLVAVPGRKSHSRCFLQTAEGAARRVQFAQAAVDTVSGAVG